MKLLIAIIFCICIVSCCDCIEPIHTSLDVKEDSVWTFVSMPDFLNVDTEYPQPGWEEALQKVLSLIKQEELEFLIVPGDLVMGHWDGLSGTDSVNITKYADHYYGAWKQRLQDKNIKYYTAVGDHDVGDNPWDSPSKIRAVSHYKQAFRNNMNMPLNGPDHMKGTAFWWKYRNVLFVSVDVFEKGNGGIVPGVTGEQLKWLEEVLEGNQDADHIIVMGHVPVLGPVRTWSSSGLKLEEGRESKFWKTLSKYNVDIYLCGEVHAVTCTYKDNVLQIAHGGLMGYNSRTSYLSVKVTPGKLYLEIKEIPMKPSGSHLWQTKNNRPLESIVVNNNKLYENGNILGHAIIDKTKSRELKSRWGYFEQRFESSTDRGVAVFRNVGNQNLTISCPE